MVKAQSGDKIVLSFPEQWWALILTDKEGALDPSRCGKPERDLLSVNNQLAAYLLGLANSPIQYEWRH